jgi:hypothetical protein
MTPGATPVRPWSAAPRTFIQVIKEQLVTVQQRRAKFAISVAK